MSSSCNALQRYHLDWPMASCPFRFDDPHASIGVTLIRSRHKPAHKSALNSFSSFIGLVICEGEQEANSCDVHPLHPRLILVFNNEGSVMSGVAIPRGIASNVLAVHSTRATKVTGGIEAGNRGMENMDLATEIYPGFNIIWDQAIRMSNGIEKGLEFRW